MTIMPSNSSKCAYVEEANDGTGKRVPGTRRYAKADDETDSVQSKATSSLSPKNASISTGTRSGASSSLDQYSDRSSAKGASLREREPSSKSSSRRPSKSAETDSSRSRRRSIRTDANHRDTPPTANAGKTRPPVEKPGASSRGISTEDAAYNTSQSSHAANSSATQRPPSKRRPQSYSGPPLQTSGASVPWVADTGYPMGAGAGMYDPRMDAGVPMMAGGFVPSMVPSPQSPMTAPEFYDAAMADERLRMRFDNRPASSIGQREHHLAYSPDDYFQSAPGSRRHSKTRRDDDRKKMPPPSAIPSRASGSGAFRPSSAAPQLRQNPSRAPSIKRNSFGEDYDSAYTYDQYGYPSHSRRNTPFYEEADIKPATRSNRRSSMYGAVPQHRSRASEDIDDLAGRFSNEFHISKAQRYQDHVGGTAGMPRLTTANLHRASRKGVPSSRSTRSSGSRDESEHHRSFSTGITPSSSGCDGSGVTLTLGGATTVTIPSGSHIDIRDMTERKPAARQLDDGRGRSTGRSHSHRPRPPSRQNGQYPPNSYGFYEAPQYDNCYA